MKSLFTHVLLNTSIFLLVLFSSSSLAQHCGGTQLLNKNVIPPLTNCNYIKSSGKSFKSQFLTQASTEQLAINNGIVLANNVSTITTHELCKSKGNVLHELIVIFNDKLQLFIAFFSQPQKIQIAKIAN
jgi:hypothetical protein